MQQIEKPPLNEGETYIGFISNHKGEGHHVILLAGDNNDGTWQDQMDWAKSIGGDLPDRVEQALLFRDFKSEFKRNWYWSNTTDSNDSGWAWCQDFYDGGQYDGHQYDELRARAVRRLPI